MGGTEKYTDLHLHRDPNDPKATLHAGLSVTSLERTLVDVARSRPTGDAVAALDHALSRRFRDSYPAATGLSKQLLLDTLRHLGAGKHGRRAAAYAINFADGLSESVGESRSRARIAHLGFAAPVLQHRFEGLPYRVDFWWPERRIIGEFDGKLKYRRNAGITDLPPEEVVFREKRREDELRKHCSGFIRWTTSILNNDVAFARLLANAGIPRG
ncbi:hypothetical protein [Lysinibacter cavernae]|uniref:DUF559 domain-containing protein n=1 Tax=Lysinibacter cavernae TaxID=1640652 RepID=A0A7X5TU00_9MICO|nr:hypothetical protein [Lysinibacter cavernae]NIH53843.1 hypothetical protein [Lysinibacter cavernae]